jgi:hypothetical protein
MSERRPQHNGPDRLKKVDARFVYRVFWLCQSRVSIDPIDSISLGSKFPKWCTARLGHTIFTRQILPSCTGDNRALIDASMIRPARADKPYACPFSGRNARGGFFTKFANPHWRVEAKQFLPYPGGKVDFRNAHQRRADQTNNKQTTNKVARDLRINLSCWA